MAGMPVVLLTAALAILVGVVVVAIGRGGELTMFRPDVPPYPVPLSTAAQVAAFRPPPAFLGYNAQATDDALHRVALAVAQRDAELARLRGELAAARGDSPVPQAPSGEALSGETPSGDALSGDAPSGDAPSGDAPSGDAPPGGVPPRDQAVAGETGELSR
jgi:hypothetical protein